MKKLIFSTVSLLFLSSAIFASTFFSGLAGGKIGYTSDQTTTKDGKNIIDPELKLQAFFAGQFNFTQNTWARMELSIDTEDFINQSLFTSTDSSFQIDELSFTARNQTLKLSNYFSAFMGTYDPIGSDIFLQRYFPTGEISSRLTDSWLGLDGSILYPHFGIGISDVMRLYNQPVAFGGYLYLNHEDRKYYVLNSDLRFACNYRYITCDFATGIGTPLSNKYKGQPVILAIEKIYWHCGTTLLVGNSYTQSLYAQAGIFNIELKAEKKINPETLINDTYLLLEPRFLFGKTHLNLTLFTLPAATVKKIQYIDDTLGADINFYSENLSFTGSPFTIGLHTQLSFENKNLTNLKDFPDFFKKKTRCYNINVMPYVSTTFLSGQLNSMLKIDCMKFADAAWYEAFSADIGYKCKI